MTSFQCIPVNDLLPLIDINLEIGDVSRLLLTCKEFNYSLRHRDWNKTISNAQKIEFVLRFLILTLSKTNDPYSKIVILFYDKYDQFVANVMKSDNSCYYKKNDVYLSEIYAMYSETDISQFTTFLESKFVKSYRLITMNIRSEIHDGIHKRLSSFLQVCR